MLFHTMLEKPGLATGALMTDLARLKAFCPPPGEALPTPSAGTRRIWHSRPTRCTPSSSGTRKSAAALSAISCGTRHPSHPTPRTRTTSRGPTAPAAPLPLDPCQATTSGNGRGAAAMKSPTAAASPRRSGRPTTMPAPGPKWSAPEVHRGGREVRRAPRDGGRDSPRADTPADRAGGECGRT